MPKTRNSSPRAKPVKSSDDGDSSIRPRSVPRATFVERATRALRQEILGGQLRAGDRIHLDETATRLDMSPVPIREALRVLTAEGLVVALPQRGYRVAPMSIEDLEDTYRLRSTLEPMAIKLAIPRLAEDDLDAIARALDQLSDAYQTSDWDAYTVEHRRFHFGIYQACGSPWLLRILSTLWENSMRYHRLSMEQQGVIERRAEEHRKILDACRARDATKAARLMRAHLDQRNSWVRDFLANPAGYTPRGRQPNGADVTDAAPAEAPRKRAQARRS